MKLKISTIERIENEFAAIESVQTQDENAFNRFHFGYCLELKDQIEISLYLSEKFVKTLESIHFNKMMVQALKFLSNEH